MSFCQKYYLTGFKNTYISYKYFCISINNSQKMYKSIIALQFIKIYFKLSHIYFFHAYNVIVQAPKLNCLKEKVCFKM
jgi:hypothetical protein